MVRRKDCYRCKRWADPAGANTFTICVLAPEPVEMRSGSDCLLCSKSLAEAARCRGSSRTTRLSAIARARPLVGRDGSIDWLALPRFDSAACFAALLGDAENGRWKIAPKDVGRTTRCYREGTLVLETRFETADGACILIDCMGRRDGCTDVVVWLEANAAVSN
jgi:Domain of unknown function (DUF5911)